MESFVFPSVETMLGQSPQRKQITELRSEPVTRKNHGLQIDSWLIYYNSWIIIGPCFVLICIPLSIHGREGDRMRGTWGDVQTSHGHPLIIPMKPCSLMFKLPISDSSSRNGEDWVPEKLRKWIIMLLLHDDATTSLVLHHGLSKIIIFINFSGTKV